MTVSPRPYQTAAHLHQSDSLNSHPVCVCVCVCVCVHVCMMLGSKESWMLARMWRSLSLPPSVESIFTGTEAPTHVLQRHSTVVASMVADLSLGWEGAGWLSSLQLELTQVVGKLYNQMYKAACEISLGICTWALAHLERDQFSSVSSSDSKGTQNHATETELWYISMSCGLAWRCCKHCSVIRVANCLCIVAACMYYTLFHITGLQLRWILMGLHPMQWPWCNWFVSCQHEDFFPPAKA